MLTSVRHSNENVRCGHVCGLFVRLRNAVSTKLCDRNGGVLLSTRYRIICFPLRPAAAWLQLWGEGGFLTK